MHFFIYQFSKYFFYLFLCFLLFFNVNIFFFFLIQGCHSRIYTLSFCLPLFLRNNNPRFENWSKAKYDKYCLGIVACKIIIILLTTTILTIIIIFAYVLFITVIWQICQSRTKTVSQNCITMIFFLFFLIEYFFFNSSICFYIFFYFFKVDIFLFY